MTTARDATPDTALDTDRLMSLWATPPADDAEALGEIRRLYTDPVVINGVPSPPRICWPGSEPCRAPTGTSATS